MIFFVVNLRFGLRQKVTEPQICLMIGLRPTDPWSVQLRFGFFVKSHFYEQEWKGFSGDERRYRQYRDGADVT